MVEAARIMPTIIGGKPRVVLSRKMFPIVNEMEIGEKGFLEVDVEIEDISLEPDDDDNDRQIYNMKVLTVKKLNDNGKRISS